MMNLIADPTLRPETDTYDYSMIDQISVPDLVDFVTDALNAHGTDEQLAKANKIASVLMSMLEFKNLINVVDNTHQTFVNCLLVACMIHNLFYDESDWTTLFDARRDLADLIKLHNIPEGVSDAIFQTVEAQMGDATPVPNVRPQLSSPTELFAYAVWFVNKYELG